MALSLSTSVGCEWFKAEYMGSATKGPLFRLKRLIRPDLSALPWLCFTANASAWYSALRMKYMATKSMTKLTGM